MSRRRVWLWGVVSVTVVLMLGAMVAVAVAKRAANEIPYVPAPATLAPSAGVDYHTAVTQAVQDLNIDPELMPDSWVPRAVCWRYAWAHHEGYPEQAARALAVSSGLIAMEGSIPHLQERALLEAVLPSLVNEGGWCDTHDAWSDPAGLDLELEPVPSPENEG